MRTRTAFPGRRSRKPSALSIRALVAALVAVVIGVAGGDARADAPAQRRPNIMLVSIDTLSANHLALYGYNRDTMPFLGELAKNGAVVERFTAASTQCLESHMTMMTGLAPSEHGVHGLADRLDGSIPTLAATLHRAGYRTVSFNEDAWLAGTHGFGRGFDRYMENRTYDVTNPEGLIRSTFDQAADWMKTVGNAPFFLFVHTYQAHWPYAPPDAYRTLFHDDPTAPPADQLKPYEADRILYDEDLRYIDDELRRLWQKVRELGHESDTVLVVTSDHGEAFLEHGSLRHASYLFEEQTRVPLVMTGPGIAKGVRVPGQAGHIDIMPTLVALAGAYTPPGLPGISLVPFVGESSATHTLPARAMVSETWSPTGAGVAGVRTPFPWPAFAATLWPSKLARYQNADGSVFYQLYNLEQDPGERTNLWPTAAASSAALKDIVDHRQAKGIEAQAERSKRFPPLPATPAPQPEDPTIRTMLHALGEVE